MSDGPSIRLDAYRKAAKKLKRGYSEGDGKARARVHAHVSSDKPLKHADFLFVIARETGHESWPTLKFALESAAMTRPQRAERLKMALYHGQHWVTERLLSDDANLAHTDLGVEIALYDLDTVTAAIATDPEAATRPIGNRTPILHLAFSKELHRCPDKRAGMMAIAELLRSNGAEVNDGYPPGSGDEHRLSALYGALCHADNFELGAWLLANGATPNDNESLYHSTELGHTRALELLLNYGAQTDGTNALLRALDFDDLDMVRLMLEHGASPNAPAVDHSNGQSINHLSPLHHAARRGCSAAVGDLLLEYGADPCVRWNGHTPYATARIFGNRAMAESLEWHGFASDLDPNELILANCAEGQVPNKKLVLADLSHDDRLLLTRLAFQPGKLEHMKALVAAGLDPDQLDEMKLSPLHHAAWTGMVEETDYFLSLKPDLTARNAYGGDVLGAVVHGAEFAPTRAGADHITCARLLLEAGSDLDLQLIGGCGNEDMVAFLDAWLSDNGEGQPSRGG